MQGSLEALTDALRKLDQEHEEVRLSFVHRAVGGISESDINLAAVANATVIGFNVRPDRKARELAESEKVEMRLYEVIYQVLDDVNERAARHAQARVRRDRHRRGRGPRGLRRPARRQGRGLLRAQRRDHPRLEGPVPA